MSSTRFVLFEIVIEVTKVDDDQVETGEAWLLADTPENVDGAAGVKFGDSLCSVGGYDVTTNAATNQVNDCKTE